MLFRDWLLKLAFELVGSTYKPWFWNADQPHHTGMDFLRDEIRLVRDIWKLTIPYPLSDTLISGQCENFERRGKRGSLVYRYVLQIRLLACVPLGQTRDSDSEFSMKNRSS